MQVIQGGFHEKLGLVAALLPCAEILCEVQTHVLAAGLATFGMLAMSQATLGTNAT